MSKIVASKVYQSYLPDGQVAISFIATDRYAANLFVNELQHLDKIDVTAKKHKESRSIRQNSMLWGIISKISDVINGEHSNESMMKIYGDLLVKSNAKRELIAVLPSAINHLTTIFRAVIPTGQTITSVNEKTSKIAELVTVWVYYGSSKFDTKEMTDLIDTALNYASDIGIVDSEIESMRVELYE